MPGSVMPHDKAAPAFGGGRIGAAAARQFASEGARLFLSAASSRTGRRGAAQFPAARGQYW
jgi:hypothetical protein